MTKMKIGKTQKLTVLRTADFGVYLGFPGDDDDVVLLPKKQVPDRISVGSEIEVFVYKDSEDRLISTTRKPYVHTGEFAYLKVKGLSRYGAFLDWGLEKDLFMPFKEQEEPVKAGDELLVYVYLDKSERLCATGRVYDRLKPAPKGEFADNDEFEGYVYRTEKEHGAFTAVIPKKERKESDGAEHPSYSVMYYGLISAQNVFKKYRAGEKITGRVARVRTDRKLDLVDRLKIADQIAKDAETVLLKIDEFDGTLPFSESASPELIKRELAMSKSAFKKALGHLLKERKIEIGEDYVRTL